MRMPTIDSRRVFMGLAGVLTLILIALVIYLIWFVPPNGALNRQAPEVRAGLEPVLTIEGPGAGDRPMFARPLGAAFGPDGRIYVSDSDNNRICVFDPEGAFLFEFGGTGILKPAPGVKSTWEDGLFNFPVGIDVDEHGDVYVADLHNNQIQVFDAEGTFLRAFPDPLERLGKGSSGQGGTGLAVTDIAVVGNRVYATDSFQIVVFDTQGELLAQFGKPGTAPGDLSYPNGIDVAVNGTLYVADSDNNRIQSLTPTGGPVWALGERVSELQTEVDNAFGLPRGITVLDDGSLLVVDAFEFVLKHVTAEGKLREVLGERGVEPAQFNFPNSVDDLGDLLVVADKENDRVQVLRMVEE
ncbi:MAG: NHL repeat-containing protein [Coriobacteriia bacterium]